MTAPAPAVAPGVLAACQVVVCAGPGGVGKTTVAAALGLAAARQGRRVAVLTIDPARRLGDALGLRPQGNDVVLVERDVDSGGSLHISMLDSKRTFDAVVARHAPSAEQRAKILDNPFYRSISTSLSGTQEYMASERLYELHTSDRFDLVVLDTPPTSNALDFLDSANQLTRLFDHRLYRALLGPGATFGRVVAGATRTALRPLGRVVGLQVIDDAVAFLETFRGMEEGFRDRAQQVRSVLGSDRAGFVLVCSAASDSVDEASFVVDRLAGHGITPRALVVNRMLVGFDDPRRYTVEQAGTEPAGTEPAGTPSEGLAATGVTLASEREVESLRANLAELRMAAADEERAVAGLTGRIPGAVLVRVPEFDREVTDLGGIGEVAAVLGALVGPAGPPDQGRATRRASIA